MPLYDLFHAPLKPRRAWTSFLATWATFFNSRAAANLHDEIVRLLSKEASFFFPANPSLYATAYRSMPRDDAEQTEVWLAPLAVGGPLPVFPLALTAELCLPIDLESTYMDAGRRLRLDGQP